MSGQYTNLYKLQNKKDIQKAGVVLADAFQNDPVWTKVFEKEANDLKKMSAWYESAVRYCLKYGEVYATSEKLEGIAGLVPGDFSDMTMWRALRSGSIQSGMKMGMAMSMHAQKMKRIFAPLQADRKANMKGRAYIYFMIVGVASKFQGQGHGEKLIGSIIDLNEQKGLPIYLETETVRNVKMYEKLGFKLIKQITLPVINRPMWEMVRELRT
jgi:ribosomal protein S18 acetylase RimI-like enzyme